MSSPLPHLLSNTAMLLDAAAFARRVGIEPDPWQAKVLRSSAPRMLLNCSRQSGKSTTVALLALHEALYRAPALVLMVSRAQRQSAELFRKALAMYRALGRPVPATAEAALTLELKNGSRIVALPGKDDNIRSCSDVRLLLIDEAARVPTETYMAVRPMLIISGGRLIALSTPVGTRGWWYEAWRSQERWERYKVPASDCPRIRPEDLAVEQASMGNWWYDQEYQCIFRDAQDAVFRQEDIDRMFEEDYETWDLGAPAEDDDAPAAAADDDHPDDDPDDLWAPFTTIPGVTVSDGVSTEPMRIRRRNE